MQNFVNNKDYTIVQLDETNAELLFNVPAATVAIPEIPSDEMMDTILYPIREHFKLKHILVFISTGIKLNELRPELIPPNEQLSKFYVIISFAEIPVEEVVGKLLEICENAETVTTQTQYLN